MLVSNLKAVLHDSITSERTENLCYFFIKTVSTIELKARLIASKLLVGRIETAGAEGAKIVMNEKKCWDHLIQIMM